MNSWKDGCKRIVAKSVTNRVEPFTTGHHADWLPRRAEIAPQPLHQLQNRRTVDRIGDQKKWIIRICERTVGKGAADIHSFAFVSQTIDEANERLRVFAPRMANQHYVAATRLDEPGQRIRHASRAGKQQPWSE